MRAPNEAPTRFREDLFFRLAVVRIQVPALRGRADDVVLLAHHFAAQLGAPTLPGHKSPKFRGADGI